MGDDIARHGNPDLPRHRLEATPTAEIGELQLRSLLHDDPASAARGGPGTGDITRMSGPLEAGIPDQALDASAAPDATPSHGTSAPHGTAPPRFAHTVRREPTHAPPLAPPKPVEPVEPAEPVEPLEPLEP